MLWNMKSKQVDHCALEHEEEEFGLEFPLNLIAIIIIIIIMGSGLEFWRREFIQGLKEEHKQSKQSTTYSGMLRAYQSLAGKKNLEEGFQRGLGFRV